MGMTFTPEEMAPQESPGSDLPEEMRLSDLNSQSLTTLQKIKRQ